MIEYLEPWQWLLGALGAFFIGLGKGGIAGIGNLTVVIYAAIFPAKESVGILLPILIVADIIAVIFYRKHADWDIIKKVFPFTILGTVLSFFMIKYYSEHSAPDSINEIIKSIIGWVLVCMALVHWLVKWLKAKNSDALAIQEKTGLFSSSIIGILIGFTSMTANAAGPVSSLYFMMIRLPKYIFIGTSAWLFLSVNLSKVPFQIAVGMITIQSLLISLCMSIFAIIGGWVAPKIVKLINQKLFDLLIWFFIFFAGIKMILG